MATLLMPFSVPFEPTLGSYAMFIPVAFRNHTDSYTNQSVKINPGVSRLRFTWDGKEGIRYRIDRAGLTGPWVQVIEPSTVQVARSSRSVEIALTDVAYIFVQTVSPASAESINARARAGVTVIPMAGPMPEINYLP